MLPSLNRNANQNNRLISLLGKGTSMSELKKLHARLIVAGLPHDDTLVSKIISFSATSNLGDVNYSYQVFLKLSHPTIFNWNTIIRAYSQSKNPNRSISIFVEMLRNGVTPDHLTYPFLAKAAARLLSPQGLAIHACIAKTGYESDRFILNSLIHMYASCSNIVSARKLFDDMPNKNSVSWNSMVDGYAKCGELVSARQLFELMPRKDVVSWSCLIDGYVKGGKHSKALEVFDRMRAMGPHANEVTLVSVLCACAHLGALEKGRKMHRYVMDNGLPLTLALRTSLVDMYAKCGAVEEAMSVFRGVSKEQMDVLFWNTMIGGLASHGLVKESLELFREMQMVGSIIPDEITYLCLLSACAHGGLVKEAWGFFDSLEKQGMVHKGEHYACMVDVLARAGQVGEAYEFLCRMPVEPTASVLGALLSGCMNHGRLDIAEIVGKRLIELEPEHDGRYVGLSNVYAVKNRWDEAKTMRETMERRGVKKSPGCSLVEISGRHYRFLAHGRTHPLSDQIKMMLDFLVKQIKSNAHYRNLEQCLCLESC